MDFDFETWLFENKPPLGVVVFGLPVSAATVLTLLGLGTEDQAKVEGLCLTWLLNGAMYFPIFFSFITSSIGYR